MTRHLILCRPRQQIMWRLHVTCENTQIANCLHVFHIIVISRVFVFLKIMEPFFLFVCSQTSDFQTINLLCICDNI